MRHFICVLLFLTATSFVMEIVMPLLSDQHCEQLASVSDGGDEDDTDDKDEDETENLKDDLFLESAHFRLEYLISEEENRFFNTVDFPVIHAINETPFSPPEMSM